MAYSISVMKMSSMVYEIQSRRKQWQPASWRKLAGLAEIEEMTNQSWRTI
jgi:hypothetical protein